MVEGVLLADSSQDADRLGDGRLVDHDLSESALEGTVLLNVLSVLVKRRRLQGSEKVQLDLFENGRRGVGWVRRTYSDAPQFSSGEHRLEQIRRIHTVATLAGHYQVHLCVGKPGVESVGVCGWKGNGWTGAHRR